MRGRHNGTPVRKCLDCGTGLYVRPFGAAECIAPSVWRGMERVWAEEFPEDESTPQPIRSEVQTPVAAPSMPAMTGKDDRKDARFCADCGDPVPVTAKFCQGCGRAVSRPAPASVEPALAAPPTPSAPPARPTPSTSWADTRTAPAGAVATLEQPPFRRAPAPDPTPAKRPWSLLFYVGLLAFVGLGVVLTAVGNSGNSGPSGEEVALGAVAPLSPKDQDLIDGLGVHSSRWNETLAPVVRDYYDESVNGDDWLETTTPTLEELRGIVDAFEADVLAISDPGVSSVFEELADNYTDKFNGVIDLFNAVLNGDDGAQEEAKADIKASADKGTELALNLLDNLRPFIDEDDLNDMLAEKAAALQEQMS